MMKFHGNTFSCLLFLLTIGGCASRSFYRYDTASPVVPVDQVWCEQFGLSMIGSVFAEGHKFGTPPLQKPPKRGDPPQKYHASSWTIYGGGYGCEWKQETRVVEGLLQDLCEDFQEAAPDAVSVELSVRMNPQRFLIAWDLSTDECRVLSVRPVDREFEPRWVFPK